MLIQITQHRHNMKKILGLDLGTNSIGWALTNNDFDNKSGNIEGLGSRIIPMAQDVMGKFESGVSITHKLQKERNIEEQED